MTVAEAHSRGMPDLRQLDFSGVSTPSAYTKVRLPLLECHEGVQACGSAWFLVISVAAVKMHFLNLLSSMPGVPYFRFFCGIRPRPLSWQYSPVPLSNFESLLDSSPSLPPLTDTPKVPFTFLVPSLM